MINAISPRQYPGLSSAEAKRRAEQFGANVLPETPGKTLWARFADQFRSALIYILLFALIVDLAIWFIEGHRLVPVESIAITVILLLNAGLGVYQESKAERALTRLKALAEAAAWVIRDRHLIQVPATMLVPGDIVRVEAGVRVPADTKLIEAQGVSVDESLLTGESLPVEKDEGDEIFSGTLLTRGKGYVEVTRIGAESAAGNLAAMIGRIEAEKTPLEKRLAAFGSQVARWILILAMVIAIAGLLIDGFARLGHILLFAVALAVAAVPEGLPAVLTLTLALGVERMARKKAVVRRLIAVEALGSVTVIATDKTGTLTENRLRVKDLDTPDTERALRAIVVANDAEPGTGAGDPLELALLDYASAAGLDPLVNPVTRYSVLPFASEYKFMRVTVSENGELISYLKGAPEVLFARCHLTEDERRNWVEKAEGYAAEGFRVLALAWRRGEGDEELTFLGLALLWDPPRPEVPEAISQARAAGIRVLMVTGDHPATALAVANEVGIPPGRVLTGIDLETLSNDELHHAIKDANVFARVTPHDKLRLVEALKATDEIVAVTGDGVNDAPALKRSDVGVAMGQRGSDVAREVSDLVLLDDNFATIVAAIKEGRNIYQNIQEFIRFLFSANLALTLIVVAGTIGSFLLGLRDLTGGLFLPLTATQLLWINIITNGPPALALALDRNHGLMQQQPRSTRAPLLDAASLSFVFTVGTLSALIGGMLLMGLPRYGYGLEGVRSLVFLYATISQLLLAYSARRITGTPRTNIALHLSVFLGVGVQLLTVLVPALRLLLGLELPDRTGLFIMAAAVVLSWTVAETYSRLAVAFSDLEGANPTLRIRNNFIRKIFVGVAGFTVLLVGIAMVVLPGPAFIVIPLGLAILATEFMWARSLLNRAKEMLPKPKSRRSAAGK
jgi:P-type Ca2+ transporter type 2C